MLEGESKRHLAAIIFTDIVGYTALMERDEAAGLRARERHRGLLRVLVPQFDGEVIEAPGDESLCLFPSAVLAVHFGLALQAALRDDATLQLRIGIHVGDVLRLNGEVVGEGVNLAARIRPLAEPGGIAVSEPVWREVRGRSNLRARSLGPQQLKHVSERLEVFALEVSEPARAPAWWERRPLRIAFALLATLAFGYTAYVPNRTLVLSTVALELPKLVGAGIEQQIGFATASDGVRIAYATTGQGTPVVQVLGWGTHLERGMDSPLYDAEGILRMMSEEHRFVRYDGRGFGLSERHVTDFPLEARLRDLEAVVDAAGLDRFAIYAVSAGGPTGIAYAAHHPERVTRLVLAGTFASNRTRPTAELERLDRMFESFRVDWDSPIVRSMAVEWITPEADDVRKRIAITFFGLAGDGPQVGGFLAATMSSDVVDLARSLTVPTLVIHAQDDRPVPLDMGRELASLVPGARFEIVAGGHLQGTGFSRESRRRILDFLREDAG